MDKLLKIALMLTAIDNMSNVVNNATNNAMSQMKKLKDYSINEMANGFLMIEAGKQGFEMIKKTTDAYGSLQQSQINLRLSMMQPGGVFDESKYKKINTLATELSDRFAGSAQSYTDMMMTMKSNQIPEDVILGGAARYGAMLSSLFEVDAQRTGEFMSRATKDFKLGAENMGAIADLAVRAKFAGVGKSGAEAVEQMTMAFSNGSLGIEALSKNMNQSQLMQLAKEYTGIFTYMYTKGISGQTFGTNMRRMFEQIASPEKLNKANEAAKQFGISLNFFDKKGNYAGLSNMVSQFDKLSSLTIQQRQTIIKSLGGKQGLEEAFVTAFSTEGKDIFNTSMNNLFSKQATIGARFAEYEKGLDYKKLVNNTSWTNAFAAIGSAAAVPLTKLNILLNKVAVHLRIFVNNHSGITKLALGFISLLSAALLLGGAFKILRVALKVGDMFLGISKALKWLRIAFVMISPGLWAVVSATWAWTAALLANPITWIIIGIAALVAAVIWLAVKWKPLGDFFRTLWDLIKAIFKAGIAVIKYLFLNFTPLGLVFKHWDKLAPYWNKIWNNVKEIFTGVVNFIFGLGSKFFEAGKNIIMMIGHGIKEGAKYAVDAMTNAMKKVRNLLPFSPAKDGPLRDIHRIRLIETIAENIKPNILLDKMRTVASAIFEFQPQRNLPTPMTASVNGNVTLHLHYAPVYNAAMGEDISAGRTTFMIEAGKNQKQLVKMIVDALNNTRKTYD